jgi:hypothetical protein
MVDLEDSLRREVLVDLEGGYQVEEEQQEDGRAFFRVGKI